ncbi:PREDICTED: probable WRKY transcription factor 4 [Ipomoea nil]|uniref:probable WRKY transcription factor 4 n=1 Tax=Ipomoea nil TaxID=35883 RepID=UPI000901798A|nr:PREDICTED: probable WRKY transcription factor 4 [Ipomoea nil]
MSEIRERGSTIAGPSRPTTLAIAPRPPLESFFNDGFIPGFSPGPMTLVSSFFADSDACSFSQLLAGAMASPLAKPCLLEDSSSKKGSEKQSGYKQNRPVSLAAAALSPLLVVPPGLSPSGLLNSPGFLSPIQSPFGMSHQQALAHVTAQAAINQSYRQMQTEYQQQSSPGDAFEHDLMPNDSFQLQVYDMLDPESLKSEPVEVSQSLRKPAPGALERPARDGYNWRKYGQKVVKGSDCPRSYYRCTHLKCPVKKKVERSVGGHITEITYKGQHNHELPNPNKRRKDECDLDGGENIQVNSEIASHSWTEMNTSNEAEFSESAQFSTKLPSEQVDVGCDLDDMEETAMALDEDDVQNPKKRSSEVVSSAMPSSLKTVTESRIIVQTRSDVDLLDDGYKWRKYGQKVVKGNANPRSYYRCTYSGCSVRKHVERASTDPKAVITTYEGKHNHDIPNGRNSNRSQTNANVLQLKQESTLAVNS